MPKLGRAAVCALIAGCGGDDQAQRPSIVGDRGGLAEPGTRVRTE